MIGIPKIYIYKAPLN